MANAGTQCIGTYVALIVHVGRVMAGSAPCHTTQHASGAGRGVFVALRVGMLVLTLTAGAEQGFEAFRGEDGGRPVFELRLGCLGQCLVAPRR